MFYWCVFDFGRRLFIYLLDKYLENIFSILSVVLGVGKNNFIIFIVSEFILCVCLFDYNRGVEVYLRGKVFLL